MTIREYFERKNGPKNTVSGGTWTLVQHPTNENAGFIYSSCKDDLGEDYPAEFKLICLVVKDGEIKTLARPASAELIEEQKRMWGL